MGNKRHNFPALPHVKYKSSRGKWFAYFNTGKINAAKNPVYVRMPLPTDTGFFDSYAALIGGRKKREKVESTVADLLLGYQRSADFAKLAPNTQEGYRISMSKIADTLGEFGVDELDDEAVQLPLDNEGWGASTQNLFVAVLCNVYKWARKRGKTTSHLMKDYERQKGGEHAPWPQDILTAALRTDDAQICLAVHLLYYTGQRIGDVCKMRWNDIQDDGSVYVCQQKTSKEVWPPIHSALQAQLDKTPKRGITILCDDQGKPLQVRKLREAMQAMTLTLGLKTVPHGLRKNAVNALLECGSSIAEVGAITGQTMQTVEHYAAKVNRRKLGKAAILKWDVNRKNIPKQA